MFCCRVCNGAATPDYRWMIQTGHGTQRRSRRRKLNACNDDLHGSEEQWENLEEPLRNNVKTEKQETHCWASDSVWNSNNYLVCSVYVELWMCVRVQQTVWVCLALLKSGCRSWRNFSLQALILFLHTEVLSRFLHPAKLFNTTEGTNPLSDSVWLEEAARLRSFDHQVDLDSLNMMVLLFEVWSYWW